MKKEFLVRINSDLADHYTIVEGTNLSIDSGGKLLIYNGAELVAIFSRYDYVLNISNKKDTE